jgi:hypothetical protein
LSVERTLAAAFGMAIARGVMMCYDVLEGYVSWIRAWSVFGTFSALGGISLY